MRQELSHLRWNVWGKYCQTGKRLGSHNSWCWEKSARFFEKKEISHPTCDEEDRNCWEKEIIQGTTPCARTLGHWRWHGWKTLQHGQLYKLVSWRAENREHWRMFVDDAANFRSTMVKDKMYKCKILFTLAECVCTGLDCGLTHYKNSL